MRAYESNILTINKVFSSYYTFIFLNVKLNQYKGIKRYDHPCPSLEDSFIFSKSTKCDTM